MILRTVYEPAHQNTQSVPKSKERQSDHPTSDIGKGLTVTGLSQKVLQ